MILRYFIQTSFKTGKFYLELEAYMMQVVDLTASGTKEIRTSKTVDVSAPEKALNSD